MFQSMQAAELAWWREWMSHPFARERMYALYGARYYPFFARWLEGPVDAAIEFGSGPLPVLRLAYAKECAAIDTLADEYVEEGLTDWPLALNALHYSDHYFDLALLLNVLDHTPTPANLVIEARRLLKKGGKALVYAHMHDLSPNGSDPKHLPLSMATLQGLFDGWTLRDRTIQAAQSWDRPNAYLAVYER